MPNVQQKVTDATLLYEHTDITVDAVLVIVGVRSTLAGERDALWGLKTAFNEGTAMVRIHCQTYCATVETDLRQQQQA